MFRLFILVFITNVFADYGGGYAGSGFRYSHSARDFALSGAIIADPTPGSYAFSNPALFKFTKSNHIGISIQNLSLNRSIETFSFARYLPPKAGIGVSFLRSGTKKIQGRNSINELDSEFSASESTGIISFGVGIGRKLAFGINIKALFSSIYDDYKANGISGDIGFIYQVNRNFLLGFLVKNIKAKYTWKVILGEDEHSYKEELPLFYSIGSSFSFKRHISLFFQEDIIVLPANDINYRLRYGTEFKLDNKIKIRFGAKQFYYALQPHLEQNPKKIKPSFGLGVPFKIWRGRYLNLDYALDLGLFNEGISHLFSFSAQF
jgi:hypothetical protein